MDADVVKYAVAAGISVPAAKYVYNKYQDKKIEKKYNLNKKKSLLQDKDIYQDIALDAIDATQTIR